MFTEVLVNEISFLSFVHICTHTYLCAMYVYIYIYVYACEHHVIVAIYLVISLCLAFP